MQYTYVIKNLGLAIQSQKQGIIWLLDHCTFTNLKDSQLYSKWCNLYLME